MNTRFLMLLAAGCTGTDPTPLPSVDCTTTPFAVPCTADFRARSVPAHRGMHWEEDPTFLLAGHTVPSLVHLPGGGHLLISTPQSRRGTLSIHHSTNGRTWQSRGMLPTHLLPRECGRVFLDAAAQPLPDGRIRLLVEGWMAPTGQANPTASGPPKPGDDPGTRLCALISSDGHTWTAEGTGPLLPTDGSTWPSVPAVSLDPENGAPRLFFADTYPGRDAVRRATSPNGQAFTPDSTGRVLPERHVDPDPTYVAGTTRIRLYHTWDALSGELGVAESDDGGRSFDNLKKLPGLSGQVCHTPPEQPSPPDLCRLDPAFIALSDGTLMLYYSRFQTTADGREVVGIGRAIAVD